jgi:hypothetical protein
MHFIQKIKGMAAALVRAAGLRMGDGKISIKKE